MNEPKQGLNRAQMRIFLGALAVQERTMDQAKRNFDEVKYFIDLDTILDEQELEFISQDRYSRKPVVYNKETG